MVVLEVAITGSSISPGKGGMWTEGQRLPHAISCVCWGHCCWIALQCCPIHVSCCSSFCPLWHAALQVMSTAVLVGNSCCSLLRSTLCLNTLCFLAFSSLNFAEVEAQSRYEIAFVGEIFCYKTSVATFWLLQTGKPLKTVVCAFLQMLNFTIAVTL